MQYSLLLSELRLRLLGFWLFYALQIGKSSNNNTEIDKGHPILNFDGSKMICKSVRASPKIVRGFKKHNGILLVH